MRTRKRLLALAVIATTHVAMTTPAYAQSWLDDFVTANGATVNVTPAGVYRAMSGDLYSGGSFTYRAQNKGFTPFTVAPPRLTAGCGGVDFWMGSFGLANRAELINFMRAVGQNAAGLAFQVALQAMSPTLNGTLQHWVDTIQSWTKDMKNSCQTADLLLRNSGASGWITEKVHEAKSFLRSSGAVEDQGQADMRAGQDPAAVVQGNPPVLNSGGRVATDVNVNVTWNAFRQAAFNGITDDELTVLMNMLGSKVIIVRDDGTGNPVDPADITRSFGPTAGLESVAALVGTFDPSGAPVLTTLNMRTCANAECTTINPSSAMTFEFLASRVYRVARGLTELVRTRTALSPTTNPSLADVAAVAGGSSIPLLRISVLRANPRMSDVGEGFLQSLSMVVAYDMADAYLQSTLDIVDKQVGTREKTATNKFIKEASKDLRAEVQRLRAESSRNRQMHQQEIAKYNAVVDMVTAMEAKLYRDVAMNFAQNFQFRQ